MMQQVLPSGPGLSQGLKTQNCHTPVIFLLLSLLGKTALILRVPFLSTNLEHDPYFTVRAVALACHLPLPVTTSIQSVGISAKLVGSNC